MDSTTQSYELPEDVIIDWASQYASYEELERVAKAVYHIYVTRRMQEHPESHAASIKLAHKRHGKELRKIRRREAKQ